MRNDLIREIAEEKGEVTVEGVGTRIQDPEEEDQDFEAASPESATEQGDTQDTDSSTTEIT